MTNRGRTGRRTVAVAGGKGGCGKTTTALGIALALVRRGSRPVVVDADVDVPDLHIRAGVDREPGLATLAAGDRPVQVLQPSSTFPGVDVLAAGEARSETEAALGRLHDLARPVVIDCPAGAGPDASAPLRAAESTVVVTTTDPESREDAAKTARMARSLDAPPTAIVRQGGGADGLGPGQPENGGACTQRQIADTVKVAVPRVAGPPLRNERVRDRHERVVEELGW